MIIIPLIFVLLGLLACALAIWVGWENHHAPRIDNKQLSPAARNFARNRLFRMVDHLPLIARSGNASIVDLSKAIFAMVGLSFLMSIALYAPSLPVMLWGAAILLTSCACVLFLHRSLSHRQRFNDNIKGRSLFPKDGE